MKNKKTNMRTMIRKIVREEVAMAINEVITELKQPTKSQPTKPVKKKSFTKNSILNDVLNETATDGDWKTLGGSEFTSDRMNELVGRQYGDMMNDSSKQNPNIAVEMGVNPNDPAMDFLKKDYRAVLKKAEEKDKQKYRK
jgi:hypothetical protein